MKNPDALMNGLSSTSKVTVVAQYGERLVTFLVRFASCNSLGTNIVRLAVDHGSVLFLGFKKKQTQKCY